MSSSGEEEAAREKYRVENQQLVQGQVIGDHATVHIYPSAPSSSPSPSPTQRVWNVPYPRNALFTGRSDVLEQLATALRTGQSATLSQPPTEAHVPTDMHPSKRSKDVPPQAISGLGGIGKTQVALEYAYRYRHEYQAVLWVQAETKEALTSSYQELARLLNLPEKNAQESDQVIVAMKQWLQQATGWLLILDNADDLALARDFLPSTLGGHVLLTTKAQAMGRFAQRVEVETLPIEQGRLFLLHRAGILAADASLEQASEEDRKVAGELSTELGGLPLALDQAGAYIEETGCSVVGYLGLYKGHCRALLDERGSSAFDHPASVTTTFSLAFQKVQEISSSSADLLRLCAFLHADDIPEEIITDSVPALDPSLHPLASNEFELNALLRSLLKFSLLQRNANRRTFTIHRLVQVVLSNEMDEQTQRYWAAYAVRSVSRSFPFATPGTWATCERCLPHAYLGVQLIQQWRLETIEAAGLLYRMGRYFTDRASYQDAASSLLKALAIYEKVRGEEEQALPHILNTLAEIYYKQGKYAQVEQLCQRALALARKSLGSQHPIIAIILKNLADLSTSQGQYLQAEKRYQQALKMNKKLLGAKHHEVGVILNNMAFDER